MRQAEPAVDTLSEIGVGRRIGDRKAGFLLEASRHARLLVCWVAGGASPAPTCLLVCYTTGEAAPRPYSSATNSSAYCPLPTRQTQVSGPTAAVTPIFGRGAVAATLASG